MQTPVEPAITHYREALRLNPDESVAAANLGALLLNKNQPAEAEPLLRHATEVMPNWPTAFMYWGDALIALGKRAEARDAWSAVLQLLGDSADNATARRARELLDKYPALPK